MARKSSPEDMLPVKTYGWAARDSSGFLSPFMFSRRATLEDDIRLKILYCGICHTDLHYIKNDWGISKYPLLPGHEIVGEVTEVGNKVTKVKVGDKVGIGCLVSSCRNCVNCEADIENYCPNAVITMASYNHVDGSPTYGGFSNEIVCNEHFVVCFPEKLPLDAGAPLLCAGITVYSPMKTNGFAGPGKHVGINGLGGLGHVAIKFAKAMGAKVTVISRSLVKKEEAIDYFGADEFLVSQNPEEMKAAMGTMDGIIDCVSAKHELQPLFGLLKPLGKIVLVGVPVEPLEVLATNIIVGGKSLSGSYVGGLKETQEMLDFAAEHNITADIEVIPMDYVNTAMERLANADVRYRFVIDVQNTLKSPA